MNREDCLAGCEMDPELRVISEPNLQALRAILNFRDFNRNMAARGDPSGIIMGPFGEFHRLDQRRSLV